MSIESGIDGDPVGGLVTGAFDGALVRNSLPSAGSGVGFFVGSLDDGDKVGSDKVGAAVGRGATVGGSFFLGLYARFGSSESD